MAAPSEYYQEFVLYLNKNEKSIKEIEAELKNVKNDPEKMKELREELKDEKKFHQTLLDNFRQTIDNSWEDALEIIAVDRNNDETRKTLKRLYSADRNLTNLWLGLLWIIQALKIEDVPEEYASAGAEKVPLQVINTVEASIEVWNCFQRTSELLLALLPKDTQSIFDTWIQAVFDNFPPYYSSRGGEESALTIYARNIDRLRDGFAEGNFDDQIPYGGVFDNASTARDLDLLNRISYFVYFNRNDATRSVPLDNRARNVRKILEEEERDSKFFRMSSAALANISRWMQEKGIIEKTPEGAWWLYDIYNFPLNEGLPRYSIIPLALEHLLKL